MASLPSAGIMTFGGFTNPRTAATTTTSSPTSTINPLSATPTPDFAYVSYVPSKSPISVRVCEGAHDGLNRGGELRLGREIRTRFRMLMVLRQVRRRIHCQPQVLAVLVLFPELLLDKPVEYLLFRHTHIHSLLLRYTKTM